MVSVAALALGPIAQVSLRPDEARRLAGLLGEPASSSVLEFVDDEANELRAEWDARGRWVELEALPARLSRLGDPIPGDERAEWPRDPTLIRLPPDQADELARFLREVPPA